MASRSEQLVVGFPKQQIGAEGLPSALRWPARRAWATLQISGAATGGGLYSCRPRADLGEALGLPKGAAAAAAPSRAEFQARGPAGSIVELARRPGEFSVPGLRNQATDGFPLAL